MQARGYLALGLAGPADKALASAKAYRTLQAAYETVQLIAEVLYLTHQVIEVLLSNLTPLYFLL